MTERRARARRRTAFGAALLALAVQGVAAPVQAAGTRATFPFEDATYLAPGESGGGAVFVPAALSRTERAPLVLFLHGINPDHLLHPWFGAKGLPDLPTLIDRMIATRALRPFVFAAPTQTARASAGRQLWPGFDLDAFVDAVDATSARTGAPPIDRNAIIVVGHSGAACNADGGMLRIARTARVPVVALLAIDTCLDEESGLGLGAAPPSTAVWIQWQRASWPRPVPTFLDAFARAGRHEPPQIEEVTGLGQGAHDAIVPRALTSMLPKLLAPAGT